MTTRWFLLCLWLLRLQSGVVAHTSISTDAEYPSQITLKAGVLHSPPFASIAENGITQDLTFKGFQIDLLKRLQQFAANDGVVLRFDLSPSPPQYGAALDLIANDCNTTVNAHPRADCEQFDMIVGDYYVNAERSMRIDFTPPWLRSSISAMKKTSTHEIITLEQADMAQARVCVLADAYYSQTVIREKFPNANYTECANTDICLHWLQHDHCVLYADDELALRHRQNQNPDHLEITREQFHNQYIVWPMSYNLPPMVGQLMKKWMYAALANGVMDELYSQYFQEEFCPLGRAGEKCEKFCDPVHGTADANRVCVCESVKWTGEDCSIEVLEDTNLIPQTLRILSYVMLGINYGSILVCGLWLFWQRNSAQVRVSQPCFLALVLLGCAISTSSIIAMEKEDEGDGPVPACVAIPWLYSVGFSITFGTLFAKIRRVYSIFKSAATPGVGRRMAVTYQETICVVGVVLLIDVFVLVVWTILSPQEWRRTVINQDQFGAPLESQGYCTSDHWMVFAGIIAVLHLALLGIACYMCYVARNIPTKFSESKYVSLAMISNLQILVVGVPILFIMGGSPQGSFFTRCAIIWMNNLVVVTLIFGNLMYSVHFHLEEADPDAVKAAIGEAIQSFSTREFRRQSHTTAVSPFDAESGRIPSNGSNPVLHLPDSQPHSERHSSAASHHACRDEITLTMSELEESNPSLRRGAECECCSAMDTPLPRSFLNSSESTHHCSNANDSWVRAPSNDSLSEGKSFQSSFTSTFTPPPDAQIPRELPPVEGVDESKDKNLVQINSTHTSATVWVCNHNHNTAPIDVLSGERESWSKIDTPTFTHHKHSADTGMDDEEGWECPPILMQSSSRGSHSSRLAPANLPQDGPVRLSYAASRINSVRDQIDQAFKERELASSNHCPKGHAMVGTKKDFENDHSKRSRSTHKTTDTALSASSHRRPSVRDGKKGVSAQRIIPGTSPSSPRYESRRRHSSASPLQRKSIWTSPPKGKRSRVQRSSIKQVGKPPLL